MKKFSSNFIQNILALTPLQEGMLFHYLKDPNSTLYFEQLSLEISGEIDIQYFESAWNSIIRDNEMLRSVFRWEKIDKPTQIILKENTIKPRYYDFSGMEPTQKNRSRQEIKEKDRADQFDLHDVPFRVTLCKLGPVNYEMIISNHHILYDGWSSGIILREFFHAYHESYLHAEQPKSLKTPFKEFLKWMQNLDTQEQDNYWREYLKGLDSPSRLPVKTRKTADTMLPAYIHSSWPTDLKEKLECFTKAHKITLASLIYGAWGLLLNIYDNTDDTVFGASTSGRSAKIKGIEDMVGLFINTLPLRVQIFPHETVKDFLQRIDNAMPAWKNHETISPAHIRSLCDTMIEHNEELFDTMIALENYPLNLELQPDALITPGAYQILETTHYDLTISISIFNHIQISFIYNQTIFEEETVSRLAGHFKNIIEIMSSNPQMEAEGIDIISEAERKQLLFDFNRTDAGKAGESGEFPVDKTIPQLFESQVEKTPDHIAIFGHGQTEKQEEKKRRREEEKNGVVKTLRATSLQIQMSYRQLNEQSNQLAQSLIEKGARPDCITAIMMERSIDMIIGLLGILKSGSAYLPLNPDNPQERIDYMLADSNAKILIINKSEARSTKFETNPNDQNTNDRNKNVEDLMVLNFENLNFDSLNGCPRRGLQHSAFAIPRTQHSNHLAYIIYTSGSTGNPKGVPITHANLCPLLHWGYDIMAWGPGDHVLQTLAYYFDWSAWEIFLAITSGTTLYMISEELLLNPKDQFDFIKKHDITVMEATPTRFQSLLTGNPKPGSLDTLKCLCIGAEKLTVNLIKDARALIPGHCRVFNLYGPTEATIISAASEIDMNALEKYEYLSSIPIGRMIGNGPLLVLNRYLNLCPVNVVGELYITGDGVACGYLNSPELTHEKFDQDLWDVIDDQDEKNKSFFGGLRGAAFSKKAPLIYKTGDQARWLDCGNIEFLGRIDQQVKIRGFRIELGEIENCLRTHQDIKDAVVLQEKDAAGELCLQAYIVYKRSSGTGENENVLPNGVQLKQYLSKSLPNYMIPAYFHKINQIPLTSNGKIDRRALSASGETLKTGTSYIAPQNDIEKTIAQVWQEILGVENIGIHDHFFDRGGNSLSIIRLSSRLSQALQTDIPVVTLFNNPTISALANYLRPGKQESTFNKNKNSLQIETGEIAVIGMAGRFPKAKNIDQFWENLKNGVEAITFFSKEELLQMEVNPEWLSNPDYLYVPAKGVLPGHDCFDTFFFGYTPVEAGVMDPQVRIFHECVWEALENAAYDPGNYPGTIGLFAGASPNPFWEILPLRSGAGGKDYPGLWNAIQFSDKDYLSTRAAYKLDLKGPCVTLQTACSTSLAAVDQACRALLGRTCDIALAGGVSVTLHDEAGYLYQEGTIMSPDGHCRAFDAQARGTVGGNGAGVVVLKRLTAAIADRDQVFAVIKGTGITNDGKNKVGFTAPSSEGQAAAISAALNMAGFSPDSIGYIEAHGTGTPLGDPIEIEGLKKAFNSNLPKQTKFCAIGSVKTNIGHLDAAAGIAGFIKTVLILHHRMIPPSLFFENPNPTINFENSPFYVNTILKKWESKEYPLRAGVSSFGLGGTNVHVTLEEYTAGSQEPFYKKVRYFGPPKIFYYLIPLSAKTKNALDKLTSNLAHHFTQNSNINLTDAAYTLQVGRKAFKHRCMLVCTDMAEATKRMSSGEMENGLALAEKTTVIFMFSGQGSQYVNMGLDLYQNEPLFHDLIDQCFTILEKITGLDMKPVIYPAADQLKEAEERIYQFLYTTPIKFIFEYALAKLLMSWGIEPDAMIGHSFGEYVAACLAGVFSLEDGIYLAALRGEAMHSLPEGAMLSVPLSEDELIPLLNEQLSLATVDAPSLSVVSGPIDAIEAFAKQLNDMGHECIRFRVPKAGHSRMVEPIQPEFKKKISQKTFNKPTIPYISGMSGQWITAEEATNPDYWVRHLRATVRFADGLTTLFKEPNPIFLQVGPGKGLTMFVNRHPSMKPGTPTFNMLRHPKEETTDSCYLLNQVGRLWLQGVKINWPAFHVGQNRQRISLPTYPFEENVFPVPGNLFKLDASTTTAVTTTSATPVLKKNPDIGAWFYIPSWERASLCRRECLRKPDLKEGNLPTTSIECALIVMDRSGIGRQLKEELEARGHDVFVCENENYDDFIKELAQQDKFPYRVYHLPGIDPISNPGEPGYRIDEALDRGFYSLLALTRALGKYQTDLQRQIQLEVVTGSGQEVTGEEDLYPGKAPLYGLCLVIPQEYPTIRCRCSDILPTLPEKEEALRTLIADLCTGFTGSSEQMAAYRGKYRWLRSFKPQRLEKPGPDALPFRNGGVYIITGGIGSIGLVLARHLAMTYKAKLVLTSRTELPGPSEWASWLETHPGEDKQSGKIRKLIEIQALGGQVMLIPADVTSAAAMRDVVQRTEKTFGPINGIIHSAGIVGPQSFTALADMGKKEAQMHFEPKIYGLLVLAEISKEINPDFCLVISSTAAVLGGLGFGAYSAANAFMDSYIHYLNKRPGTRWFSINWDGWQLDDQAFQDSSLGAVIKDLAMTPEEGAGVMERVLSNMEVQQVVQCTGDLQLRIDRWQNSNVFGGQGTAPSVSAFQKGPLSPEAKIITRPARPHLETPYEAPANALEEELAEIWLELLGYDRIGIRDNFFALNGDSLKAVIAVSTIHKQIGVKIPLTEFFAKPTIAELAQYIYAAQEPIAEAAAAPPIYIAIPAVEKQEYYPLSSAQKRMFILNRLDRESTAYNITTVLELEGEVDVEKFQDLFFVLIGRHESLRTSFLVIKEEPVQRIHDKVEFEIEYKNTDGRGAPLWSPFIRPFDLSKAPLMRAALIKKEAGKHILIVDMHHIISDGTSLGILVKEFIQLYQGQALTPLSIQYKDYASMQYRQRQTEKWERQAGYWRRELSGVLPVLHLPTDFPRPAAWDFAGRQSRFILDAGETAALKTLARNEDVTLYIILLSIYTIMLARLSGQEEFLVGGPIAGRNHADVQDVIGMFINTLALRCFPIMESGYCSYLLELKNIVLACLENQDYPFEEVIEQVSFSREAGRNPLFDVAFVLQNMDVPEIEIPGLKLTPLIYESKAAKLDIALIAEETADTLCFTFEYRTSLFTPGTMERFAGYFKQVAAAIITDRRQKLYAIDMLSQAEKTRLIEEFNHTGTVIPTNKTLPQLFREQAERTPDRAAVFSHGHASTTRTNTDNCVTYRQLNQQSDYLAGILIEKGVLADSIVGIMMERSIEMIIAILGILKSGGAYLPINPDFPEERINYMLKDSGAAILLTDDKKDIIINCQLSIVNCQLLINAPQAPFHQHSAFALPRAQHSNHLAYIIYTSGTTGKPKGVMVEHGSIFNTIYYRCREYKMGVNDRALQLFSFVFDGFLTSFFTPVVSGVPVVLLNDSEAKDIVRIKEIIIAQKITHFICIPSLYRTLLDMVTEKEMTHLKVITLAGEQVQANLVEKSKQLNPLLEIVNEYGPTENSVLTSIHRNLQPGTQISIGRPIANTSIYIIDKWENLLPIGVPGQLAISGKGLARGYLNKPELTHEKFDQDLWDVIDNQDEKNKSFFRGSRGAAFSKKAPLVYRTGDLARWLPGGVIQFLGRIDDQVKIRGFRIELGEIETALVKFENIKEAIVIDREDSDGEKYLCAYIVCLKEPDTEAIIKELSRILPHFMIPAYFIPLTGIPLTPNGKVDRRALPAPELKTGEDFMAPSTPTQKMLIEIWAGVLNLPKEKISSHADFFQLGGHSLKAAVMVEKIHKEIHVSIPLNKIFENPKLDALASFIDLIQLKEKLTHNIDTSNIDTTDTTREEFII